MSIQTRPSWVYGLLFSLTLIAWSFMSPIRLLIAVTALSTIAAAYYFKEIIFKPGIGIWSGVALVGLAFNYYVVYANHPDPYLAIYSGHLFDALSLSLIGLIVLQWLSWRTRDFDWLLFSIGMLLLLSAVSDKMVNSKAVFIWICLSFLGTVLILRLFPRFKTHHPHLHLKDRVLISFYLRVSGVIFLFLTTGLLSIRFSEYVDNQFNDILTQFLLNRQQQWSGFSGHTHLRGNASIQLSNQIAFTIQGDNPPDYWRGNILTHYKDGHWFPEETLHQPYSNQILDGQQLYNLKANNQVEPLRLFQIDMKAHYNGILFLPTESQQILLEPGTIAYRNRYGLMRRELQQNSHQYSLKVGNQTKIPALYDQQMLIENLQVPVAIQGKLQKLNRELITPNAAPLVKAQEIQAWFHSKFLYSLSMPELPLGQDPTLDFLLNQRPAWCSWFASGMVLMLRAEGIPAHLVSGWRSMDWNPISRRWLVREKEAHDWVEVLDIQNQVWVRFDPTPPTQLAEITGSGQADPWWQQSLDGVSILFSELGNWFQNRSWQEIGLALQVGALRLLKSPLFYGLIIVCLGINLLFKKRQTNTSETPKLTYSDPPAFYQQALKDLQDWAELKDLPHPEAHLLESWLRQISPSLSALEKAHFSQLIQRLYRIRFGPETESTRSARQKDLEMLQKEHLKTQEWVSKLRYTKVETTPKAGDA